MKRIVAVILSVVLLYLIPFSASTAHGVNFSPNFELQSKAALLYSLDAKTVLYEKGSAASVMPAQFVQLMVAALCIENCDNISGAVVEADEILFSEFKKYKYPNDLRYADISSGDKLTVEELLYAMLLTSSCEASVMLADYFGQGSVAAFVEMMNAKAKALGMNSTVFVNPHGLFDAGQLTTVDDMCKLALYALSVPKLESIATAVSFSPKSPMRAGADKKIVWTHSNTMTDSKDANYYNGAKGIKTANLQQYGRNIMVEASKDGHNYLVILMGAPMYDENRTAHYYHIEEAEKLLNWAFDHFNYESLIGVNEEITELTVENAKDIDYVILKPAHEVLMLWPDTQDRSAIQRIITKEDSVKAPIKHGQKLGTIELRLAGENVCTVDLIAGNDVKQSFVKFNLSVMPGFVKSGWIRTAIWVSLLITALYIAVCALFYIRFRRLPPTMQANYQRKKR